jgi:flagellum-specific peptidoglycan hydrolase FlgJ
MELKIKKILQMAALTVIWLGISVGASIITHKSIYNKSGLNDYNYEVYRSRIELSMDGVHDRIVTEIDNYIDSIAPDSGLNGIKLFEKCEKYGVDVRFAMAQAEIESHFGTKGMAAKTNIVWNVKTYDGRKLEDIKKSKDDFKHPDESIEPYLLLLVNSYFVDGKTEEDMFLNFVDYKGDRYASNPKYESMMLDIYNRINNETKLKSLLKDYRRYRMILGC